MHVHGLWIFNILSLPIRPFVRRILFTTEKWRYWSKLCGYKILQNVQKWTVRKNALDRSATLAWKIGHTVAFTIGTIHFRDNLLSWPFTLETVHILDPPLSRPSTFGNVHFRFRLLLTPFTFDTIHFRNRPLWWPLIFQNMDRPLVRFRVWIMGKIHKDLICIGMTIFYMFWHYFSWLRWNFEKFGENLSLFVGYNLCIIPTGSLSSCYYLGINARLFS